MDLLKVGSENVKEEIGKGIIGALDALSDDNSIENATTQMEDFGKSIGKSITGIGILIGELKKKLCHHIYKLLHKHKDCDY